MSKVKLVLETQSLNGQFPQMILADLLPMLEDLMLHYLHPSLVFVSDFRYLLLSFRLVFKLMLPKYKYFISVITKATKHHIYLLNKKYNLLWLYFIYGYISHYMRNMHEEH